MKKTIINPIELDYIDQYEDEFLDFDCQDLEGGILVAPFGDMNKIVPVGIVWIENKHCANEMYAIYNHSSHTFKYFDNEKDTITYIEKMYEK